MNGILSRSRNCKWSFYFFLWFLDWKCSSVNFQFFLQQHIARLQILTDYGDHRTVFHSITHLITRGGQYVIAYSRQRWSLIRSAHRDIKKNVYLKKISFTFNRHSGENQKLRLGIMDRSWVEYCVKSVCRTGRLAADAAQHKKYNNNRWSRFPSTTPHYTTTTHHGVVNVNPGRLNYF